MSGITYKGIQADGIQAFEFEVRIIPFRILDEHDRQGVTYNHSMTVVDGGKKKDGAHKKESRRTKEEGRAIPN